MLVHRVLIATDLSEGSQALLKSGLDIARQLQAEVTVLHIFSPAQYDGQRQAAPLVLDAYAENLAMLIRHQVAAVGAHYHPHTRVLVLPGDEVPEHILEVAHRTRADLIIMGTRGRTGLRRMLIGSVAGAVLRHADIPVFVVPAAALASREAIAVNADGRKVASAG